jgi:hypothetical protein
MRDHIAAGITLVGSAATVLGEGRGGGWVFGIGLVLTVIGTTFLIANTLRGTP